MDRGKSIFVPVNDYWSIIRPTWRREVRVDITSTGVSHCLFTEISTTVNYVCSRDVRKQLVLLIAWTLSDKGR